MYISTWSYAIFKNQKYPNKEPTILSLWSGSSKSRFHGKTTSISQGRWNIKALFIFSDIYRNLKQCLYSQRMWWKEALGKCLCKMHCMNIIILIFWQGKHNLVKYHFVHYHMMALWRIRHLYLLLLVIKLTEAT